MSQHSTAEGLPASRSLLVNYELVRSSEKNFRGKVPAQFTAEGALDRDGLERKFIPARGHITAAPLACHDEGLAA
jgi:hypothetical protein